jgi:hypothetical protein
MLHPHIVLPVLVLMVGNILVYLVSRNKGHWVELDSRLEACLGHLELVHQDRLLSLSDFGCCGCPRPLMVTRFVDTHRKIVNPFYINCR